MITLRHKIYVHSRSESGKTEISFNNVSLLGASHNIHRLAPPIGYWVITKESVA